MLVYFINYIEFNTVNTLNFKQDYLIPKKYRVNFNSNLGKGPDKWGISFSNEKIEKLFLSFRRLVGDAYDNIPKVENLPS